MKKPVKLLPPLVRPSILPPETRIARVELEVASIWDRVFKLHSHGFWLTYGLVCVGVIALIAYGRSLRD